MSKRCNGWLAAFLTCIVIAAGCTSTKSKLAQCQSDSGQLKAQVTEQQRLVENLRVQNRAIADRLAESEKLLARIHEQTGGGISSTLQASSASSSSELTAENSGSGWKSTEKK